MTRDRSDDHYMDRALREARKGEGRTGTNPLVGACLVHEGRLLGTAAHREYGGPHAEVSLLETVGSVPAGSQLYCTLEPCIHSGKTPPCVSRLARLELSRIVLAHRDPHPAVNGDGIRALRNLGFTVDFPVRQRPYRWLNRAYFYRQQRNLPWIDLKLAMSADGFIALPSGESQWITGERSRQFVHRLRARTDAVMVGANTLRRDDPRLTDRVTGRDPQPRPIVAVRSLDTIPYEATLLTDRAREAILIVPPGGDPARVRTLRGRGVTVLETDTRAGKFIWTQVLPRLLHHGIGRVLVEGGGRLAGDLLSTGVVNELHFFYSGRVFGRGVPSLPSPLEVREVPEAPEGHLIEQRVFDEDVYVRRLMMEPLRAAGLEDCLRDGAIPDV